MCGLTEWQEHADRNEISPPSRTGCAGLPVRRLARVLVRGLGQTPNVLPGDGGEGQTLTCPAPLAGCVAPRLRGLGWFPDRSQRKFQKACRATLEETRAWANFELVEILREREEQDGVHFGRLRPQEEKAWDDPGQNSVEAKPRRRKSRKRRRQ